MISNLGDKFNNTINTLVTVFADRLTSVTLMPDAYADGIPCIDFSTAQFKEMKGEGDNWKYVDIKDAKAIFQLIMSIYENIPIAKNKFDDTSGIA